MRTVRNAAASAAVVIALVGLGSAGLGSALGSASRFAAAQTAVPFFEPGPRIETIPPLDTLLGYPAGERAATFAEISRCLEAWAAKSDRVRLESHGQTWEGRPLRHLVVSSPENLGRLDEIRASWDRVANPRLAGADEAASLAGSLPAVAWLAFSIHGDEISGADASLVLANRLIASRDPAIEAMLRDLVVIFDPIQNPDGRERYLARIRETTPALPNGDASSVHQQGSWPWGRTNHYLFDMNRDWVFATQPESRGRIAALSAWHPLFFLDVHEMGLDSTYLFYPPRPPYNPYLPSQAPSWWAQFGRDEASAFDRHGWRYYTGEWADWWFPGYSDSFGTLRGAIGILHEQAGVASGTVRLENGGTLSYGESVWHQVTAAWANLGTLAANRQAIARDFARERRRAMAPDGPLAGHTLAIVPDGNRSRLRAFVDTVTRLGGEIDRLESALTVTARDPLARSRSTSLPVGTLLVRGRQPEGALLRATLDFDTPLSREVLARERAALVAGKETLLYDTSGWSLPLLFGLDAYEISDELASASTTRLDGSAPLEALPAPAAAPQKPVAWVFDGADDASVGAAARLMEAGVRLRLADRAFELDGRRFARGSVLALADDNRDRGAKLGEDVARVATELDMQAAALGTGFGEGELADLGGRHFRRLERPRIGLVGYGEASTTSFGALWFALDQTIGVPVSLLNGDALGSADLRRYNVLVLAAGVKLGEDRAKALKTWVESGGTLITVSGSTNAIAREKVGLSGVRRLADLPEDLASYRAELISEWREELAGNRETAIDRALSSTVSAGTGGDGVAEDEGPTPDKAERERREQRVARFAPQGVLLAGRVDGDHWLTVGNRPVLPLYIADDPVLLSKTPVETPVRLGVALPARGQAAKPAKPWRALGWSAVPAEQELSLRLSGLLWPEAAERFANAAYLTRESVGSGQVILFAGDPVWRGAARGTQRLLANAVVFGPGCGTDTAVLP